MDRLTDRSTIKELMEKYGFTFSKGLGQNFLINPSVCPRMAEMCGAAQAAGAIEIGPGFGVLTRELCAVAKKVTAIEIDSRLVPVLEETLSSCDNWNLINEDVLKVDLRRLIDEEFGGGPVAVCANLPYYITSPILMYLLEAKLPITSVTVLVQKEAAVRLCAEPGTRACGAISAAVRYYGMPEMLFSVSAGSFMPAPKVDSAVLRITLYKEPPYDIAPEAFAAVSRGVFGHRRKTALNALKERGKWSKPELEEAFATCHLPLTARGESLTMEQLVSLAKCLQRSA